MGFSKDQGYIPQTFDQIMTSFMDGINLKLGTSYTYQQFQGTNLYVYLYALAQYVQKNEIKTNEIFFKLQNYIELMNLKIARPVTTPQGLIDAFKNYKSDLLPEGILASVKPMIDADAGKINVCLNLDNTDPDYNDMKLEAANILAKSTAAGAVTQGAEVQAVVLPNGQSFNFKYHLPNVISPDWKLTITTSTNNKLLIKSPEDIKAQLVLNFKNNYSMGLDLEPQKYFTTEDAPWSSDILLQYDLGGGFTDAVINSDFDDLYLMDIAKLTLVEQ